MENGLKKVNNYFDGLPLAKNQLILFFIIVLAYFFEQVDNANFQFIAPTLLANKFISDPAQIATITSLYFLGMTFGGLFGGVLADIFGRRKTFLGAILLFSSMSIINGLTNNFWVFTYARALTGFGIFCMMIVSITYLAETTPAEKRGKWQNIIVGCGFCALPVVGILSRIIIPMGPEAWRIIFYIGGLGFIGFFMGLKYLKESPRWLVAKGRVAEAEKVIEDITGVAVDLSEMADNIPPKTNIREQLAGMFTGKYLKRTVVLLLLGIPMTVAIFTSGVWMQIVLQAKGFPLTDCLTIGMVSMFGSPVGLFITSPVADKGGRKIPMAIFFTIAACLLALFAVLGKTFYVTMAIAFFMNVFFMASSFIAMAYATEHYPTNTRSTAVGVINALQRLSVSGSQLLIPFFVAAVGYTGLYLGLAGLVAFSAIITIAFGISTGGKSLEEIS